MNKIIPAILILLSSFTETRAQNLLSKVPDSASVVIKYSGENFSKNLPLKKLDSYSFVMEQLSKALKMDSLTSLQRTGIDFEQDIYQYITTEDSALSFVSLFNLKDLPQFLQLLDANYAAEMKPEKKNGYEFLPISADTYIGWNNNQAVLVVSTYQNPYRYRYYFPEADTTTVTITDTIVSTFPPDGKVEIITDTVEEVKPVKPKNRKKKPAEPSKNDQEEPIQEPVIKVLPVPPPPPDIIDEEINFDTTIVVEPKLNYYDSLQQSKREAWQLEQEKITKAKQKQVALNIINHAFNGSFTSIETDISFKKVIDPAAHVSIWFNYENLLRQYWSAFSRDFSPWGSYGTGYVKNGSNDGFRTGMNLYFDKEKMRIEQKSFSPDAQMANLGKELFNSKQSTALANYVNPGYLGYLSMSINSEAMAAYYYKLLRQYLNSSPFTNEYSDIVDIYIDLLEIIIDEKAMAALMPGNYMFVLHDMKTRKVSYTDYEYDDDFKMKEVKKTRQELSPDFTFVMETNREAFMQKAVNLPLKYAKKGDYNYQDKGGYYELAFEEGKYPLSSLYFMVKNGKLVISTSKASIDMTLNNTGYTLDADSKNSILNNNYSLKIHSKKLIQQIKPELSTGVNKKISAWLEENIGDVKIENYLKDGMMQGTTTMNVTGKHANSLEFFFNMMDAINKIMEKDKEQREKKLN